MRRLLTRWRRDSGRALTPGERAMAAEMFGATLDPAPVRLHRARWWPFQPRDVIMAPDGGMWFHPEGTAWREDFATAPLGLQGLFVHELTHVWQAQRGGRLFLPLARHPFCRYRYRLVPGRRFGRYGLEQQAEIVRDAFLLRRHGRPGAAHEALLATAMQARPGGVGLRGTRRHAENLFPPGGSEC